MLKLALRGRVPLIRVETTDLVNTETILNAYLDGQGKFKFADAMDLGSVKNTLKKFPFVYIVDAPENYAWEALYRFIVHDVDHDAVLVVVNPEDKSPTLFDAGGLGLPRKVLADFLGAVAEDNQIQSLSRCLGGMNLKEIGEVCRMASAQYGKLTPRTINAVRRHYAPNSKGLQQLNTQSLFYDPDPQLETYRNEEGRIFTMNGTIPAPVIPRGIFLLGEPGVGKSSAAKYLAHELDVPLYRLALEAALSKWHGETEENLTSALSKVDEVSPCVLLMDEVEKVFRSTEDGGVSGRILATLLWWLQERTSRVLVVMTSNDKGTVPPELYRSGRLDKSITLKSTPFGDQRKFVTGYLKSIKAPSSLMKTIGNIKWPFEEEKTQAELVSWANAKVRSYILQK